MRRQLNRLISLAMGAAIAVSTINIQMSTYAATNELTEEQSNAITMLNYITVLTQDINESKNSRLYMEEAYTNLINNTYPNAVDNRTLSQLTGLLDTMESYRMIDVKRDRLKYMYEQSQADAMKSAIPHPINVMTFVQATNPLKALATIAYTAVSAYSNYSSTMRYIEMDYLQDGWDLDDEEAEVLHESRKGTFSYMVEMVGEYDLPGDLTLTENTVKEFVKWKNSDNVVSKIQFFESNKSTYESYGGYWLALVDAYYQAGDYEKCLEALATYEETESRIFRMDYELAQVLPMAIDAASEVLSKKEYIKFADTYAQKMIDNTDHDDWALRFFAAETYVDLYGKAEDKEYLEKAYTIVLDNVNYLVAEQQTMNAEYLAPIEKKETPKGATKTEKNDIKNYNKMLKEQRNVAMPPIYEPLQLNCDLLFSLAEELDISDGEKNKIYGLLHPSGEPIFLTEAIDNLYYFEDDRPSEEKESEEEAFEIEYAGNGVILPVANLTDDPVITVTVKEKESGEETVFTDWTIDKVARDKEDDISTFEVALTSKEATDYDWQPDETITINVKTKAGMDDLPEYNYEYTTSGTKKEWFDYLKVWEGHKNNWYDYAKVWENSVSFERVE